MSLLTFASVALSAQASVYTYSGSTIGGLTFNRPIAGAPPLGLSGTATAVAYSQLLFSVTASGAYSFSSIGGFDNFTVLYMGGLDASDPLANALISNDDDPSVGMSGFSYELTAGTTYGFVTTAFDNSQSGEFRNSISGPGEIIPSVASAVPGPLAALPFALMAIKRRRRA